MKRAARIVGFALAMGAWGALWFAWAVLAGGAR